MATRPADYNSHDIRASRRVSCISFVVYILFVIVGFCPVPSVIVMGQLLQENLLNLSALGILREAVGLNVELSL